MKARERVLGELHFECRASHSKSIVGPADNGTRRFYYDWHVPVCLVLGWWFEVCFHRSQEILWKGVEGTRGMNNKMWRYRLIPGRCSGIPERCRGEERRCAATRTRTLRTGVVAGSANLEKTGLFLVKTWNKWLVFQCTVN